MEGQPRVSVIVPTYERPNLLERCLQALWAQDLSSDLYEVIVVDDGSGQSTREVLGSFAEQWPQLRWTSHPTNRGPAAARNVAIDMACGEWLLFVDDDIVATPGLVRTHLEYHEATDRLLGILGRVTWHPELKITPFMRWLDSVDLQFAFERLTEGPVANPSDHFYTCNLSVSRSLVVEAGGFDEAFPYPAHEDSELAIRLCASGFRLDYQPSALAWNARPITLKDFCRRMTLVGESSVILHELQGSPNSYDAIPFEPRVKDLSRSVLKTLAILLPVGPVRRMYYRSEVWRAQNAGIRRGLARNARK